MKDKTPTRDPFTSMSFAKDIMKSGEPPPEKTKLRKQLEQLAALLRVETSQASAWDHNKHQYTRVDLNDEQLLCDCTRATQDMKRELAKNQEVEAAVSTLLHRFIPFCPPPGWYRRHY